MRKQDPGTREEWQEAVDAAHVLILIDGARRYGLISGGPAANIDRCVEIVEAGKKRGILPAKDAIERVLYGMNHRGTER